ncbi:MAG: metallophosphoesterase [Deltaproteobacteria bacterium]|nr:metallophosphoesterase [Deltaproteobacteria bacterium]
MKIIYLADIHGDFDKLNDLLNETFADVYIISGDLIDIPFYSMNTSIRYHELQSYFHGLRRKMSREDMLIEDFVDDLLEKPDIPDDIQESGTQYQEYTIRARRVMQQKYKVLGSIISMKQRSRVFCLPGNYDMDLKYTALHEHDLHLHWYQLEDLRICGYGGAAIWTPGIPERYVVHSQEKMKYHDRDNEMYHFFKAINPHIIVTHQPAYGIHDQLTSGGSIGSTALRSYCEDNSVMMCLTGHIHQHWGAQLDENTLYLNPSNFGEVTLTSGNVAEGGFYYSINVEAEQVRGIIFKKFYNGRIYDVADYHINNGKLIREIIDPDRYNALEAGKNYDEKDIKDSHIPEVTLYNDIKQFYRKFQTQETEERLNALEDITYLIEDKLKADIAMDVMGSVNFGISQSDSDIDVVLYLRCDNKYMQCNGKCVGGSEVCDYLKNAEEMIAEILKDKFDYHLLDYVDLNRVEESIREKNYESAILQRFVFYRSLCRPINYRVIAPTEDMLNKDMMLRKEIEGSLQVYFKIFVTTSRHIRSFMKYESRLSDLGIKLPTWLREKVKLYLGESKGEYVSSP